MAYSRVTLRNLFVVTVLMFARTAMSQLQFESAPINYLTTEPRDRVSRLQLRLDAKEIELPFDEQHGYLSAVLDGLGIPRSSQMLVFSQTSFQLRRISPERPRAIYFNDDTYVGWVQGGDVIEVSAVDPRLGAVFYTLDQRRAAKPRFVRDKGQCTTCHASTRTQGVPGHLVRSVFPDGNGRPLLGSGTYTSDHRSPFEQRWGGWYVTGTHGKMRHMGNVVCREPRDPDSLNTDAGANRTDLKNLVDTAPYLEPTSDLVSLMVLEHQTQMHNYLTLANFETRHALHYNRIMNEALQRPVDYLSESTRRRIERVAEKLVRYMLFDDEFSLTSPVEGVSDFAKGFSTMGPRDGKGRSLRDLDLTRRLFKYPCSYLIYSPAFDGLPDEVRGPVCDRLVGILNESVDGDSYEHLNAADRLAIREILRETKPELAPLLAR
jgi:hypothetical protein